MPSASSIFTTQCSNILEEKMQFNHLQDFVAIQRLVFRIELANQAAMLIFRKSSSVAPWARTIRSTE
jgi:hypothetical protein